MRLPHEHAARGKKRLREGSDPELDLLYWLFVRKNLPPWEIYSRPQGFRDLVEAFAAQEMEDIRTAGKARPRRR